MSDDFVPAPERLREIDRQMNRYFRLVERSRFAKGAQVLGIAYRDVKGKVTMTELYSKKQALKRQARALFLQLHGRAPTKKEFADTLKTLVKLRAAQPAIRGAQ